MFLDAINVATIGDGAGAGGEATFAKHPTKFCNVHRKLHGPAFGIRNKRAVGRIQLFGRARDSDVAIAEVCFAAANTTCFTLEVPGEFGFRCSSRGGCGGGEWGRC